MGLDVELLEEAGADRELLLPSPLSLNTQSSFLSSAPSGYEVDREAQEGGVDVVADTLRERKLVVIDGDFLVVECCLPGDAYVIRALETIREKLSVCEELREGQVRLGLPDLQVEPTPWPYEYH
jgi:hypothetical protein